jgi:hypothetical protein
VAVRSRAKADGSGCRHRVESFTCTLAAYGWALTRPTLSLWLARALGWPVLMPLAWLGLADPGAPRRALEDIVEKVVTDTLVT